MLISDHIAHLIETLIEESGGAIELKRNDMAQQLGCAPSQINYVITSRFTPERGYTIESRRGGGGYIRIVRHTVTSSEYLTKLAALVSSHCEESTALSVLSALHTRCLISQREAHIMRSLLSRSALSAAGDQDSICAVRASLLQKFILCLMQS